MMGLRQVFFTTVFILPSISFAHSQAVVHTHAHSDSLEQRFDRNLPRVNDAGQRVAGANPVYIYNNNRDQVGASSVQSEPTTYVQAAPLSKSRAEQMRAARKDMEVKTEEKIVEKLEESRIADEQRRAERLFGNKMGALHSGDSQWQAAPVQKPAVQAVVPAPVVQQEKVAQPAVSNTVVIQSAKDAEVVEEDDGSLTISERNSLRAEQKAMTSGENWTSGSVTYIAPMVGAVDQSDASNVESNGGFGGALGILFETGLALEGSFVYSNHEGRYNYLANGFSTFTNEVGIDQYNVAGAVKYYIGKGRIQPFIGGVLSYTRREYVPENNSIFDSNSSDAFDGGITAGADIAVTKGFRIGLDYRFMQNISNEFGRDVTASNGAPTPQITSNGIVLQQFNNNGESFQSLEDMSYHVLMLTGKLVF